MQSPYKLVIYILYCYGRKVIMIIKYISLVPRPLPVFQCFALKNRKAWFAKSCDTPICGRVIIVLGLQRACGYLKFGRRIYIAVYGTGIASSQATLSFSMFRSESPFHILAGHVTSRTRPFRFSVRNIEKLGVAWERG